MQASICKAFGSGEGSLFLVWKLEANQDLQTVALSIANYRRGPGVCNACKQLTSLVAVPAVALE